VTSVSQEISWIPIDVAALIVKELRNAPTGIFHISHPRPVSWSEVAEPISQILKVPLVSFSAWLERLASSETASAAEIIANPSLLLLEFFYRTAIAAEESHSPEVLGMPRLSIDRVMEYSDVLKKGEARRLGGEEATKWLAYWKQAGFLTT
jgi:hypothetical protein